MDLAKDLTRLGLSDSEAKVYLSCLQLGRETVLNIAKHADLKRPSVYLLLENLEKRGLVTKTKKAHKTFFKAEEPGRLLSGLKMQEEVVNSILPSLEAIYNIDPKKPNIKIAEGNQSVANVYNGIFNFIANHPKEELLIFGALKEASKYFQDEVQDYFMKVMAKSKNRIREVGNNDPETRRYFRQAHRINPNHEIRLIRSDGSFQCDNMIFGNTVVIFSVDEQIFSTIIESAAIAQTYRTMFNMAWKAGKKYII
ncbi:MAG: helix-turn-helix domain-containing protein [Patescibacteria group bacterium]